MPIRSLDFPAIVLFSSSFVAAQSSTTPTPRPAIAAPRYVGPMGSNPNPSAFPAIQPKTLATIPLGNVGRLTPSHTKKSTCYAIHSYTVTPQSDTVGITHLTGESTCIAAENYTMKQTAQPASGPDFQ